MPWTTIGYDHNHPWQPLQWPTIMTAGMQRGQVHHFSFLFMLLSKLSLRNSSGEGMLLATSLLFNAMRQPSPSRIPLSFDTRRRAVPSSTLPWFRPQDEENLFPSISTTGRGDSPPPGSICHFTGTRVRPPSISTTGRGGSPPPLFPLISTPQGWPSCPHPPLLDFDPNEQPPAFPWFQHNYLLIM
jgi:hypothetical protein